MNKCPMCFCVLDREPVPGLFGGHCDDCINDAKREYEEWLAEEERGQDTEAYDRWVDEKALEAELLGRQHGEGC